MAEDIGYILFVQLLGMTQYPGSPFSGNIPRDLIMFFLVPTIFIILIVYTMTGRVVPGQPRLRLLLGIGAYLFILAGGYYSTFALLAGPYFIILIFFLGLLGFFRDHFSGRRPVAAAGGGGGGPYTMAAGRDVENMSRQQLLMRKDHVTDAIRETEKEIRSAERNPIGEKEIQILRKRKLELQDELREVQEALKFVKHRFG